MAKPFVYLLTSNGCRPCYCGLGRNLLKELEDNDRCDGVEFNLSLLPKDHVVGKWATRYGFRHFPAFLFFHPTKLDIQDFRDKVCTDTSDKWKKGAMRKEVDVALDKIWGMP